MYNVTVHHWLMKTVNQSIARILAEIENGNQSAMSRKTGIPQPSVGRIASGATVPTLENIEKVANAYHFAPWQLFVPDFDPRNAPILRQMSPGEEALYKKFKALREDIKQLNGT